MPEFGRGETPNGDSSDGPGFPRGGPRDSRDLPSLLSSSYPITVTVRDSLFPMLFGRLNNRSKKKIVG